MKDLGQEQDGSEIKSRELELLTDRVQNLGDRRDAFEAMRDLGRRGIPHRDRRYLAPAQRIAQAARPETYLSRHRRPRLPARPQGP